MEDFNWMNLVWAALPIVTGLLASLWLGFKAKAANDGVQDWKDDAVTAVDKLLSDLSKKDAE